MLIDAHCHVAVTPRPTSKQPRDPADVVLDRARAAGVGGFVVVGVGEDPTEARDAVGLAHRFTDVVAAVGIHPHDAKKATADHIEEITKLASDARVAAVGEIGLDFHYDHSPREEQREVFRRFVALAKSVKKPIVIHTRSAGEEVLAIMEEEGVRDVGGIIHCFSEDMSFAKRALDLGFDLSFSGIVTFKTATAIQEVARDAPIDRILVETDAPYLAPIPLRGKTCEPAYVTHTAKFVAGLRNIPFEDLAARTTENALRRFPLLAR